MVKYSKKQAVSIAISCAKLYRDNFVDKKLLFLLTDKHKRVFALEVEFDASNYHHLTGLQYTNKSWSHLDFYNHCIDARLSEKDIGFSANGSTHQKLNVLPVILRNPNLSANMAGDYNHSRPYLFTEKLVGGVKWAMGFRSVGAKGRYVPDTLLEGDIRGLIKESCRIAATYKKSKGDLQYTELIYKAKKVDLERLVYPKDWGDFPRL